MQIKYDIPKLEQIVNDIFVLTGLSISFLDWKGEFLCEKKPEDDFCSVFNKAAGNDYYCRQSDAALLKRCKKSHKFESHICHAGLYDAMTPVMKNDVLVGYVLMGRIRSSSSPDIPCVKENQKFADLYRKIPYFTDQQILSLQSLLQDILFVSAVKFDFDQVMDEVVSYIEENLQSELKVDTICTRFGISKNYLYGGFQKYYGVTVNEYITKLRLDKAKRLMEDTKKPIYEICEEVGIYNYTYFCKLFKKRENMSPGEFRKRRTGNDPASVE